VAGTDLRLLNNGFPTVINELRELRPTEAYQPTHSPTRLETVRYPKNP